MGSRLLKRWIHQPIRQTDILLKRQKTIGEIIEQDLYHELQPYLQQVGDMERILARIALRSARPRDLTRLRTALEQIEPIKDVYKRQVLHTPTKPNVTISIMPLVLPNGNGFTIISQLCKIRRLSLIHI